VAAQPSADAVFTAADVAQPSADAVLAAAVFAAEVAHPSIEAVTAALCVAQQPEATVVPVVCMGAVFTLAAEALTAPVLTQHHEQSGFDATRGADAVETWVGLHDLAEVAAAVFLALSHAFASAWNPTLATATTALKAATAPKIEILRFI
jgi:hypothetical protein